MILIPLKYIYNQTGLMITVSNLILNLKNIIWSYTFTEYQVKSGIIIEKLWVSNSKSKESPSFQAIVKS